MAPSPMLVLLATLGGEPTFVQHPINPKSAFEAAGAFDVDGDGRLDVVCGDSWYQAPNWTKHPVRPVEKVGTYYNCFATLPMDVNSDGKMDYVTVSYFGKDVAWVENPGKVGAPWTYHEIDTPGPSEAAWLVDLDGDGQLDVLPNTVNVVTWFTLDDAGSTPKWTKHDFGKDAAGHGVGSGDVNGDSRTDLLTPKGWFESPRESKAETWTWHPEWNAGAAGIQMLARDVDGDNLADVVYGMGHDYGLHWLKQGKGADGSRTWTKHDIDTKLAQAHTLLWADLDLDGRDDELVTGKRVYAHEVEPGDVDASTIAWYRFDRKAGSWSKHTIFQGEPAKAPADKAQRDAQKDFPPNTAGTGLQMTATDLDGDGDIDLVCPGKSGLYWFENRIK
jgi:hypothetical protein